MPGHVPSPLLEEGLSQATPEQAEEILSALEHEEREKDDIASQDCGALGAPLGFRGNTHASTE